MSHGSDRMTKSEIAHPVIALREEWLVARKKLLGHEKDLTEHYDRVNAERRRLPMVKIEKDYVFDGPHRKQNLKGLFDGRPQLIVYHFMFDPTWDKGCTGCTGLVDALRRSVTTKEPRHDIRGGFSRPAGQARSL